MCRRWRLLHHHEPAPLQVIDQVHGDDVSHLAIGLVVSLLPVERQRKSQRLLQVIRGRGREFG
jgi:hypothetical protein